MAMSLLRYFEPINRLPTPEEAGLSASTTQAVNQAVEKAVLVNLRADAEVKTKVSFTPEDRAMIGKYAAESMQIAVFKFAIYPEKPETQLFYYAIKTRPTVYQ